MKTITIILTLLLCFGLCSCSTATRTKMGEEDHLAAEATPGGANANATAVPTSPDDEPPPVSIEYPDAYQDALDAYKPILDALLLLAEAMSIEEYDASGYLYPAGFVEFPYPYDGRSLGYALVDINGDGVLELLLGSVDGLNGSAPNSIFTLKDGQPVLLISFWSRSHGVISADGTIFTNGSGGAAYTYLSSYRLESNADALTQLTDMRSDYSDSGNKPYYVQIIDGRNHYISQEEFFDFHEMYADPPEKMQLTVIPIAP